MERKQQKKRNVEVFLVVLVDKSLKDLVVFFSFGWCYFFGPTIT